MTNGDPPSKSHRFDYARLGVVALVVIATGFFTYLVLRAEQGVSRALDTFLITVIGIGASVVASVIIGRWSAQKSAHDNLRPFLRTAFRSHGELILGLDRVAEEIREASDKLTDKLPLSATKARVQEQYQRALEGLENWKELLPEGIEELVEKILKKREEEEKYQEAISEIKAAPFSQALQAQIEKLTKEKERIAELSPFVLGIQGGEARRLVLIGAYGEAVSAYSRLIKESPKNYTLYLARARTKYLAGDKTGALKDLDEVDRLHPEPEGLYTSRLRVLISEDKPLSPATKPIQAYKESYEGNNFLAAGDGDRALDAYRRAAESGLFEVYTSQNYTMAYLVKGDVKAAREHVAKVDPDSVGPFIKVQHFVLLALCAVLESNDCSNEIESLKKAISACTDFNLNRSPLQFLEQGLQARGYDDASVRVVFDLIRKNPPLPPV